ncbi:MAG: hypothetical protein U9P00_09095, partial [Pseudomonadota bacterium]|nr:hypothetical protein [Pseudomonadota bacterium]
RHTGRRYLWTDAFAVCNFLGLARVTRDNRYRELALRLVDQVHQTLGRHRDDDPRNGWISGLSEHEGRAHPTRGGLRIGKELAERAPDEPANERLEWDRDGQYFHYLTKWMHALDQLTRSTRRAEFNLWSRELAATAFDVFTYLPPTTWASRRMYWKMSIDLSRPLVPSMGQHDPLDGYITVLQLRSTAASLPEAAAKPDLADEARQFAAMIRRGEWATTEAERIGGLLIDAYRIVQLAQQGTAPNPRLLEGLLDASLAGLQHYARSRELQLPVEYRLAFRELGLAIGLHAAERMWQAANSDAGRSSTSAPLRVQLEAIMQYAPMRDEIESFWRNAAHRDSGTWSEHRDINEVMLATSLAPDGFLVLLPPG